MSTANRAEPCGYAEQGNHRVYVVCDHFAASKMGKNCGSTRKDRLGAPQLSALPMSRPRLALPDPACRRPRLQRRAGNELIAEPRANTKSIVRKPHVQPS